MRDHAFRPGPTAAFHMCQPQSIGSDRLRDCIEKSGLPVRFLDAYMLARAFELMELYADRPMGLADASLVAAAESLGVKKIFTINRTDFAAYRVRRGHRHDGCEVVP